MKPDHTCFCINENENTNENDYETTLKMMRKLNATIVTVWYADTPSKKEIIAFGALSTMAFIFHNDDLLDIASSEMSLEEWVAAELLLGKKNKSLITIYR